VPTGPIRICKGSQRSKVWNTITQPQAVNKYREALCAIQDVPYGSSIGFTPMNQKTAWRAGRYIRLALQEKTGDEAKASTVESDKQATTKEEPNIADNCYSGHQEVPGVSFDPQSVDRFISATGGVLPSGKVIFDMARLGPACGESAEACQLAGFAAPA
jgi:hypothetical protein